MQHHTIRQESNKDINKPEQTLKKTHESRVRCNGGAQSSGHPAVYLTLNEKGFVVCPYCSRRFEQDS